MNKKKNTKINLLEREKRAFPFLEIPLNQRLKQTGAVDLTNNFKIKSNNGYWIIKPIDKAKLKK